MTDQRRVMPQSELDLHLMMTDGVWGKSEISPELKDKLLKYYLTIDKKTGNQQIESSSLWGLLGFYTRDLRLANLSYINGELKYATYYLDLANDFLHADMIEPFLICLSRVATLLEISQSKGGFLRKQMNTLRMENMQGEIEPPKKSLFGAGKNKGGEM